MDDGARRWTERGQGAQQPDATNVADAAARMLRILAAHDWPENLGTMRGSWSTDKIVYDIGGYDQTPQSDRRTRTRIYLASTGDVLQQTGTYRVWSERVLNDGRPVDVPRETFLEGGPMERCPNPDAVPGALDFLNTIARAFGPQIA